MSQHLTPEKFTQQSWGSAANFSGRYYSRLLFLLFFLFSWNTHYCPISIILKTMASEQPYRATQKIRGLAVGKETSILSTLHGIANCVKNGAAKILYPPTSVSISLQCCPDLILVRFENLVHNIFRNKKSTLEINVSNFGVRHCSSGSPLRLSL